VSLYTEQAARRDYRCGRECGEPIKAGTRYVRAALPPGSEMGNTGWWVMRLHGRHWEDCPANARKLAAVRDTTEEAKP
jgi:hypothetical protein